ncbi:site-specific DNA-methyltransferase [Pseudothermotoga elfii]|uniref:site-specific DNA-methyltransferase n=1 Tax=Pseudothermotoga elfii TaxID=38322 RepID=UPI0004270DDB|nr:site-specific DNA-methyltransferase [Pseudothermotoga elfii]
MANNKKYVELLWYGKYEKIELGNKMPIERPNLPFQVVETINKPRIKGEVQSFLFPEKEWPENYPKDWKNLLIWGDNKLVMSSLLKQGWAGKINLIYIDPPFFTGADFTIRTKVGDEQIEKAPSIIEERAYRDTWSGGIASYLKYMYERLVLMRELLAENGTIWVHLDEHVGHYVKVMMDEIFGYENFLNEIVWYYPDNFQGNVNRYANNHNIILVYSKTLEIKLNRIKIPLDKPIKRDKRVWDKEKSKIVAARDENGNIIYELFTHKYADDVWTIGQSSVSKAHSSEYLGFDTQKPEELLRRIILSASNPGDIVADFFCGSGTTLAVAEKLGRRWIGCDLSKFAIQVTRKRLLDIHNSKDLLNDDEKKKKLYGKPARPFEVWNIGNYETIYWKDREDEYLAFMLKLYQAQPLHGFRYLHGRKGDRIVHVGPLNAPVTMEEVEKVVLECRANNFYKADILGWEWSYEVNELAKELAKKNGVDIRLIQIPSVNEIKSALVGFDLQLLKIPDQVVEKELAPHIKFPEVAYLEIETEVNGREVVLKITDFQLLPTAELAEIADKIKDSRELIDYWAIDWDYKGDTFHNQWQSFRKEKEPRVEYEAKHRYDEPGEYTIMVKVIDVFGTDTNKVLKVRIK